MKIIINGSVAVLKKGTSFEYVAENRMFTGSDGYTLSITFPLKDCHQNIAIFGHINRQDVEAGKVIFDCEIRHGNFLKFGTIVVNNITEKEVKTQFLEGRSEQNFDATFDDIYINELTLGGAEGANGSTPSMAWHPQENNFQYVALPWVNAESGNIQNLAEYDASTDSYSWDKSLEGLSWMPYLIYITEKICEAVGYECDLTAWQSDPRLRNLIMCNVLPYAWGVTDFARALPHWTVSEYFEKLEILLGGEFTIDHREKRVSFTFTRTVLEALPPFEIKNIVSEFTSDVYFEEDKCEYSETKNLVYKECNHVMWKFYSCDWFIKAWKSQAVVYDTLSELLQANNSLVNWEYRDRRTSSNADKLMYAKDVNVYFVVRCIYQEWDADGRRLIKCKNELRPVNLFGGRIVDEREDANVTEIEFVPARIDETEDKYGNLIFNSFSGYSESSETVTSNVDSESNRPGNMGNMNVSQDESSTVQSMTCKAIEIGEQENKSEYYDVIYVAFWDASMIPTKGQLPHPVVEDVEVKPDWSGYIKHDYSLRIENRSIAGGAAVKINPKVKKTFKFLADSIPNPRAIFFIKGKKYLCEKLTATFSENGMSQLIKGIFWPIVEEDGN